MDAQAPTREVYSLAGRRPKTVRWFRLSILRRRYSRLSASQLGAPYHFASPGIDSQAPVREAYSLVGRRPKTVGWFRLSLLGRRYSRLSASQLGALDHFASPGIDAQALVHEVNSLVGRRPKTVGWFRLSILERRPTRRIASLLGARDRWMVPVIDPQAPILEVTSLAIRRPRSFSVSCH